MPELSWPDFLVIGAPKSGTTTLHDVLDSSDSVCMSRIKEPRYFNRTIDFGTRLSPRIMDRDEYLSLWSRCGKQAMKGEVSPTYFHDSACPKLVREQIPHVRLVLLLRDPVMRAVSHFHFKEKRTGRSDRTLGEAIDLAVTCPAGDYEHGYLLEPGFYGRHLEKWLEFFELGRFRIILLECLDSDFASEMEGLFRFLGAPVDDATLLKPMKSNVASMPISRGAGQLMQSRHLRKLARAIHAERLAVTLGQRILTKPARYTKPSASDVERLTDIYRDDIRCFESLSGVTTGWRR